MSKIAEERLKKWKDKLVDLSKRNRLLNFRPTKVTTVKIVDELPSEILNILTIQKEGMEFLPVASSTDEDSVKEDKEDKEDIDTSIEFQSYARDELAKKHKDKYLQTTLTKEKLSKNLFRIYSKANSVMEEQGYNVLFLSLGCLEFYESEDSDVKLRAPIILIPVELTRTSVRTKFKLKYHEEEPPILNPALIIKLQNDFGITINPIDEELENKDPQQIFSQIQTAIKSHERWRVSNDIYLSLFSFAKFIMYKDIEKYMQILLNHLIIKLICGQPIEQKASFGLFLEEKDLDGTLDPLKTFQILDADSSQQQAILAVKNGKNLVIEGPPGTGKSQTIANIIAEFLSEDKKVLFVSQKMAALEVVKKRLDNNGLGDFCLELHSRKVNKSEVIKELVKALEMQKKPDHSHDEDIAKLKQIKEELNGYVKAIHTSYGKLEMTPYQAFGIINSHPDIREISFVFNDSEEWERKRFNTCCDLLDNLAHNLSNIHNPTQHPWYGSQMTDIHYQDKLRIAELMNLIFNTCSDTQNLAQLLAKHSFFNVPSSIVGIESLIDASKLLLDSPHVTKQILQDKRWDSLISEVEDIIKTVRVFNEFKTDMGTKYNINYLISGNIDVDSVIDRYGRYFQNPILFFVPAFWKDRKVIRKHLLNKDYKPNFKRLLSDLKKLKNGKKAVEKLKSKNSFCNELFGTIWKGIDTEWDTLDKFSKWMIKFRYYITKKYFNDGILDGLSQKKIDIESCKTTLTTLLNTLNQLKNEINSLIKLTEINESLAFGGQFVEISLVAIVKKISSMKESMDLVDNWIRYQSTLKDCQRFGLEDFIDKIFSSNVPFEKIVNTFKCQFLRCWLDVVFSERDSLKKFYGMDHENLIEKFRNLDQKQIELAKIRIQHMLSGKFDTSYSPSGASERGILLRESRKSRAHMPIRKLFEYAPNMVINLKPCLMMSPLTVAQFLNPELIKFDLVIFDEASQIPPEDSLGAILRGKQVVIAGDSKQLPPTTFFQSEVMTFEDKDDSIEEIVLEDLDSILDECAVSEISKTMLRWHYRSKHESLIAFSNKSFYDNHLLTFPCAEEECPHLGIKFHCNPNTTYGRGSSGANIEEAREVAKAVFRHFRENPELSLGVGTFSIRQKYAIEDAIEEMLKDDTSLEVFFAKDRLEHFFIKNLETIQGDERDIIFISVGYGRDASGKLSMNFGPINKVGGARRLNVLITRARKRVEIFTSIRGDDIDLTKTDSQGVQQLKHYLDFAEKGKAALQQEADVGGFLESPFEESVYNLLVSKGFKVGRQVGCSGYRIDLAILDDKSPGRYLLGIECDGAYYHSSNTARDRDRLRQQVLEDLNWNIYRIWSTDWFKNPRVELERLIEAIVKAKEGEFKKKLKNNPEYLVRYREPVNIKNDLQVKDYSITPIQKRYSSEDFYDSAMPKICAVLEKVIEHEGPIHEEEAQRRTVQYWGIRSVGSRIRAILEEAEYLSVKANHIKKKGKFYWPIRLNKPNVRNRESLDNKSIKLVAPEEIGEAALIVLKNEYSMPKDDLIYQTARLIGFNRITDDVNKYVWESIKSYMNQEKIVEINERFTFNEDIESIEETQTGDSVKSEKVIIDKSVTTPKKEIKVELKDVEKIIIDAVENQKVINIEYNSPSKGFSVRDIKPFKYDGIYIKAFCYLVNAERTFRIDRIKKIQ